MEFKHQDGDPKCVLVSWMLFLLELLLNKALIHKIYIPYIILILCIIGARVIIQHTVGLSSITNIPYGPTTLSEVFPEC